MSDNTLAAIVFIGFYATILLVTCITESGWCLLILLFVSPSYSSKSDDEPKKEP